MPHDVLVAQNPRSQRRPQGRDLADLVEDNRRQHCMHHLVFMLVTDDVLPEPLCDERPRVPW